MGLRPALRNLSSSVMSGCLREGSLMEDLPDIWPPSATGVEDGDEFLLTEVLSGGDKGLSDLEELDGGLGLNV